MKTITNAKELSSRIAEKLGLSFEAKTYAELKKFVEEVTPAIGEEFIRGKTSFEDFWRGFEDDSPLPSWRIITDKETLKRLMEQFGKENVFGDISFWSQDFDIEGESLDEMPDEGMIVADIEPNCNTADILEKLRTFSEVNEAALFFQLYNVYPFCEHFTSKLGDDANTMVWRIGFGKISTDEQEIVVFDGAEGEYLLIGCWWLGDLEIEELEKYGIHVALETAEDAPKTWKMLDCGLSAGLRVKYGK